MKRQLILDWTPNTNHTGLYVAKEKGYFNEAGVTFEIVQPPEGSATELVATGKAEFGIGFQDYLGKRFARKSEITAIAAILEHNTAGILSDKDKNIVKFKDLEGKTYGTWDDPIELGMIKELISKEGGNFQNVKLVPNSTNTSVEGIVNKVYDAAQIFYGWDGILSEVEKVAANMIFYKDYDARFDFYSPVIISNNKYLKENKEEAQKVLAAIKKGYQFAMENPEEAAQILIKYAPELKSKEKFVTSSQKWLATQYASDKTKWGEFDAQRWNGFYEWVNEKKLIDVEIPLNYGFTNEFLGK